MFKMKLTFCSGHTTELLRVDCLNNGSGPLTSVRGKTHGAYRAVGSFQWSSAVRGMACVFLSAKLLDDLAPGEPMLTGEAKSLAASLDYALTKQPTWILDMFGVSLSGRTHARRLFRVTNSHRKRGGPVALSLNLYVCPPQCIEIVLDGQSVHSPEILRSMLQSIKNYSPKEGASNQNEFIPSLAPIVEGSHLEELSQASRIPTSWTVLPPARLSLAEVS